MAANSESARARLRERTKHRVGEILQNLLDKRLRSNGTQWLDALIDPVLARDSDPYAVANELLTRMAS